MHTYEGDVAITGGGLGGVAAALSASHITNGAYRLHPVEWKLGESAGLLAAHCQAANLSPEQVRSTETHLREFQRKLEEQGVPLSWPAEIRIQK